MVIKNYAQLATSALRRQALIIAEAGYEAINTEQAVKRQVRYNPKTQRLDISRQSFNLTAFRRVICVGFGKAALRAVGAVQEILRDRISCGYVLDLKEGSLGNIVCRVGTHPLPTEVNIEATGELVEMLRSCDSEDLVICVVSGGGSALLCSPHAMSCENEVSIIAALTAKGANIQELNTVRKHISRVKGGQLAKILYPATCVSLIFSDVPGDDLSMVASGPTVRDNTTNRDAAELLKKYDVLETCGLPAVKLQETPKEEKYFAKVHNILVVSAESALRAMSERAEELGFKVKIYSSHYQGLAKDLAQEILAASKQHQCLLGAGESTVKILGDGQGGRNQEMALAGLKYIRPNQVFLCLASDGHDNTDAAGAVCDAEVLNRAKNLQLDPEKFLRDNDSYNFYKTLGDAVLTGLTDSNVADFFVVLQE